MTLYKELSSVLGSSYVSESQFKREIGKQS